GAAPRHRPTHCDSAASLFPRRPTLSLFFFQAEDGIRDRNVTGVQTCALPISRDIRKLGGLMSVMPLSFTVAFIGSLSMAGLPPFGGFLSKELFLTSMLAFKDFDLFHFSTWGPIFLIVAWVASVFTFIY